jgi:hypothetical protein
LCSTRTKETEIFKAVNGNKGIQEKPALFSGHFFQAPLLQKKQEILQKNRENPGFKKNYTKKVYGRLRKNNPS